MHAHPLKMVYVENVRLPTEKAHGYQIMKTCEAFSNQGLDITLLYANRKNRDSEKSPFVHFGIKQSFRLFKLPVWDILTRSPSCISQITFYIERWTFAHSVKKWTRASNDCDIWYTRDLVVAQALISTKTKKPIFLEMHDSPLSNRARWNSVKNKISGFIVITQALKDLLLKQGIADSKICVATDGFDMNEFVGLPKKIEARRRLHIDEDKVIFVYTGHLFPWKGVDTIVRLSDQIPVGSQLVIVGGNPEDRDRLEKSIPCGTKNLLLIGHVSHAEVLLWLAASDAAILPTSAKFEIGRLYTSPMKLFEYLAAGLPVIASDVPSSHEILDAGKIGLFFEADSSIAFIHAVQKFMTLTVDERQQMSAQARNIVMPFTWTERANKIIAFMKMVCAG